MAYMEESQVTAYTWFPQQLFTPLLFSSTISKDPVRIYSFNKSTLQLIRQLNRQKENRILFLNNRFLTLSLKINKVFKKG